MDLRSLSPFGRGTHVTRRGSDDPFAVMRREMDRMLDTFSRDWPTMTSLQGDGFLSPKVDIAETDAGLELTAELPGVKPEEVSLDLSDGVLTLKAEHKAEKEQKDDKKHYHLIERSHGAYLRRFTLPFEVDEDKVEAKFDEGVLKVSIPHSATPDKPTRKIEIRST